MRRIFISVSLTAILLCSIFNTNVRGAERLLKAVLVVVNGTHITQDDLNEMAQILLIMRHKNLDEIHLTPEENEELAGTAMRELIRLRLIIEDAREMGLSFRDDQVQGKMEKMGIASPNTPALGREYAEAEMLIDAIFRAKGIMPYEPTPKEVRELFNAEKESTFKTNSFVIIRHIFLPTLTADDSSSVKMKIDLFKEKIMEKPLAEREAYFSEIAKEFSEDKFAIIGGLLRVGRDKDGWFKQEFGNTGPDGSKILPDALYQGIQSLREEDKGKVSKVIRSDKGFHLLFLSDIKGGKDIPWKEAQQLIRMHLERKERQKRVDDWFDERVKKAKITWHDGEPYPVKDLLLSKDGEKK